MDLLTIPCLSSLDASWDLSQPMLYLPWSCLVQDLGGLRLHLEGASAYSKEENPPMVVDVWEGKTETGETHLATESSQNMLCLGNYAEMHILNYCRDSPNCL